MSENQPAAAPNVNPLFELPTTTAEGQPMTARQQFDTLRQNPDWANAALQPGTRASQQLDDLNRRMAADTDAAESNASLDLQPATDVAAYQTGIHVDSSPQALALDGQVRSWLLAAEAPGDIGSALVEQVGKVAKRLAGADAITIEREVRRSRATLESIYGAELDKKIASAGAFLEELDNKHPGVLDLLEGSPHVLRDATVTHLLIQLAEAKAHRNLR